MTADRTALKAQRELLRKWLDKMWADCCDSWKEGGPTYCYYCMCPPEAHALQDVVALLDAPAGSRPDGCKNCAEERRQGDAAIQEVWEDVLRSVQRAWTEPHDYADSPLELVTELIDERDDLRARLTVYEATMVAVQDRLDAILPAPRAGTETEEKS